MMKGLQALTQVKGFLRLWVLARVRLHLAFAFFNFLLTGFTTELSFS